MKITEYPKTETLANDNVFLVDGEQGTQGILAMNVIASLLTLLGPEKLTKVINLSAIDQATAGSLTASDKLLVGTPTGNVAASLPNTFYDIVDMLADGSAQAHNLSLKRAIWRGKNLGEEVTPDQYAAIANGSFKGLFLGDYWSIGGQIWRIMDFDYWLNTGDTPCWTHHLVITPDKCLYARQMNETNTTAGGYNAVRSKVLNTASGTAVNIFGNDHLLSHRELFTNAITNGYPSAGGWYDSIVDLPNEPMVYGSYIFTPANNGSQIPYRYTIDKTQLAAFAVNPVLIVTPDRQWWWLRDVVSSANFALVYYNGLASYDGASYVGGVRPVFGIKG